MAIYYLLITIFYPSIIITFFKKKYDKIFFLFLSILIIGIIAFREKNIGMDTMNYIYYFNNPYRGYTDGRSIDEMEPAYTSLNLILRNISSNKYFFIFTTSLLSIIPIITGIFRYSKNRTLSLFLLLTAGTNSCFIVFYFSMIRQTLAISCLYIAIYILLKNQGYFKKRCIIWLTLAVLFHFSSIVAIPFFFFYKINIKRYLWISLIASSIILGVFANIIHLSDWVELIYLYTGRNLDFYFGQEAQANLMAFLPFALIAICIHFYGSEDIRNHIFTKIFSIGVILNNVFSQLMPNNSDRIVLFYTLAFIWVVPMIYKYKNIPTLIRNGIVFSCVLYYTYKLFDVLQYYVSDTTINGIAPYKSFL